MGAGVLASIVGMQGFDFLTCFILSNGPEFHKFVKYLVFQMEEVGEFLLRVVINEHGKVLHTSNGGWEGSNNV